MKLLAVYSYACLASKNDRKNWLASSYLDSRLTGLASSLIIQTPNWRMDIP